MWWKLTRSEFEKQKGRPNRKLMKLIVESNEKPGILAYYNDEPIRMVCRCAKGKISNS